MPATRRLIQQNAEGVQTLAPRLGLNPKTVHKWRRYTRTAETGHGPKSASTVLIPTEKVAVVLFRQETFLPPDDGRYALQGPIPHLSFSAVNRCFQRQDSSRLPPDDKLAAAPKKPKFRDYSTSEHELDFAELQTG